MKNKNSYILVSLVMAAIAITSCEDILEEDITNDQLLIVSPREGDVVEGNTVQFLWNSLEGAERYTLQIYNNSALIQDTTVSTAPYVQVLSSDLYEWRIKAENGAYETQYTFPESFEVTTSLDLTNQTVLLSSPSDNLYTNSTNIIFTWSDIFAADSFTFELLKESSSGNTTVYLEEGITETSLQIDNTIFTEDAKYQWRVKAVNETSETVFSTRTLYIDTVAPPSPSLISPEFEEEFVLSDIITFSWNFPNDPGPIDSTITSFYDIASDQDFTTIIESGSSIITNFNFTLETTGTYYWRVRGEDQAGNIGPYNLNGKFIVND